MRLYRVFHHLPNACITASGGALYVPSQGAGRLDNPEVYKVLYLGDSPAGVVAEVFGRRYHSEPGMFRGLPMLPGSAHALATYEVPDHYAICDLDDPHQLIEVELRPSRVIARDYEVTQAWASVRSLSPRSVERGPLVVLLRFSLDEHRSVGPDLDSVC
jgi:RES domain